MMIVGEKVRLRAFDEEDLPLMWQSANDWETARLIGMRYPSSLSDQREGLREMMKLDPHEKAFAIEAEDGSLIGDCALCQISWEDRRAGLDICIGDKTRRGQGYGTDATRALVRFGFEEMNLNRIWLTVNADNARAIRCYEKVGFVREGVKRQAVYCDGAFVGQVMMSVLREDYLASADRSAEV
jgi:RimJ/RimL family protein N-acetyltransferase